jgi:hypothetical protein
MIALCGVSPVALMVNVGLLGTADELRCEATSAGEA